MWIFTRYGFFSAVCGRTNHKVETNVIMVRARKQEHLEGLRKRFKLSEQIAISDKTDYRYRLILNREQWVQIASELAAEVDYGNFKDTVARELPQDQKYNRALHDVWDEMYGIQD
jgi:hypothetical protein